MHYNSELPLKLTCDASPTGVGAVLSHGSEKIKERPIVFASRTLTKAERNYSQLDKEALALIFAVKHFHQYVYGRQFVLETDHKPLIHIFGPKKGIPVMAASRLQRWAVLLSAYEFEIKYQRGIDNGAADSLSRMLVAAKETIDNSDDSCDYSYLNYVTDTIPYIDSKQICMETAKDPVLKLVKRYAETGWPGKVAPSLEAFRRRNLELTIQSGCLMWVYRVIIPASLRKRIVEELHEGHLGVIKMKMLARSCVWWPRIDKDIEEIAKGCRLCVESADIIRLAPSYTIGPGPRKLTSVFISIFAGR